MRRVKCRFIAASVREVRDVAEELARLFKDKKPVPTREELFALAESLQNIPHWFEAEFDESPARTAGFIESVRVPGTLRDLGPVTPEELKEYLDLAP